MNGRDLIGIAKTGSGKTIAFLLPMFRHIMDQRALEEGEGPIGTKLFFSKSLCKLIKAHTLKKDLQFFSLLQGGMFTY